MQASHLVARHRIELQVDSETAARELYSEVSASFDRELAPVLDEVFTAWCPAGLTLRLDRVEIDAGCVSRDGLMRALAAAARDRLEELLAGFTRDDRNRRNTPAGVAMLAAEDVALERVALFLRHGATTWRHSETSRADIEEMLVSLLDRAPAELLRLLRAAPVPDLAQRIWAQMTPRTRRRLLEWRRLRGAGSADRWIAEWAAVLTADEVRGASGAHGASAARTAAALFERLWRAALVSEGADAAGVLADAALASIVGLGTHPEDVEPLARALAASARLLSHRSAVRRAIVSRAAAAGMMRWPEPPAGPPRAIPGATEAARRDSPDGPAHHPPGGSAGETSAGRARAGAPSAAGRGEQAGTRSGRELEAEAPSSAASRRQAPFEDEPLRASHAGVVILWPFLPGLFEACGLVAAKRFVGDDARERAVLLAAHLADGQEAWDEHDLLVEKLLCGHPWDAPLPVSLALTAAERRQSEELLDAAIGHWRVLGNTSRDGLRSAFLRRAGTASAIASGWKLQIARAGHDVLLDSLPWGIGLVLLPWMEAPLHVEW